MLENLFPCPDPDKTMDELTVDTKYLICIFKDLLRYQDIVVTGSYQEKKWSKRSPSQDDPPMKNYPTRLINIWYNIWL